MTVRTLLLGLGLYTGFTFCLIGQSYGTLGDASPSAADKAIWAEDFEGLDEDATKDEGDTAWTTKTEYVAGSIGVKDGEFRAEYTSDELTWTSEKIDISKAGSVNVSVDIRAEGSIDDDPGTEDHFRLYAIVDGGKEQLLGKLEGYLDKEEHTLAKGGIKGKSVQLVIRLLTTGDDEIFTFDDIKVMAE